MAHGSKGSSKKSEPRDSRELLMDAARSIFSAKGFDGATVKDLAEEAGVNVSLVSYYFGGKEGLYKAILERFGMTGVELAERVLKQPESYEDFKVRLKLFVEEFLDFHLKDPETPMILHRECAFDQPHVQEVFLKVFVKIFERLMDFMKSAQKSGYLRKDLDIEPSTLLFMGGIIHVLRTQPIQKKLRGYSIQDADFRERVISSAIRNFLEGTVDRTKTGAL